MNLKKIITNTILINILFLTSINCFASDTAIDIKEKSVIQNFGGTEGDYFESAVETSDGGIILVGSTLRNNPTLSSGLDGIIVKYDKKGNEEWSKTWGGNGRDEFESVIETSDKGFICMAFTQSTEFDSNAHYFVNTALIKYDKDGNQEWLNFYCGMSFSEIKKTSDNGIIAVGSKETCDVTLNNCGLIIKYDEDGNQDWLNYWGGSEYEEFWSVTELSNGDFVVGGRFESDDIGLNKIDYTGAMIVKYDKKGNFIWQKAFDGDDYECFYSIEKTDDGGFVAVGESESSNAGFNHLGGYDAIIVKYDKDGNQEWAKSFSGSKNDTFKSVKQASDGNLIAVGYSYSNDAGFENKGGKDAIIVMYNLNGEHLETRYLGGLKNEEFKDIVYTSNSEYIAIGESNSTDIGFENTNGYYGIIARFNPLYDDIFDLVINAENTMKIEDLDTARDALNKIEDNLIKENLQNRLNKITPDLTIDLQSATANLDIYIKCENMLSLSLDTNSVTFEDFSGVEDLEKINAVNLIVNSSLPYEVNAYLATEIQNADKSKTMDKNILNIKANSELIYKTFNDTISSLILLDNQLAGNGIIHGIDLKLKGGIAHEKDVYKTVIRFEAKQK